MTDAAVVPAMSHRAVLRALSGLLVGMFVAVLSSTIVTNALPTIMTALDGGQSAYTWVVTTTLLLLTATTPLWGKLSDLFSKKLLVQLSLTIYIAGSVLAGLAPNLAVLITARAVQGIGVGGITALSQVCLAAMVAPRQRGRYSGYLGATFALATVAGPLLGGLIVDTPGLGWRACFAVPVPFALLAILVLQRTLRLPVAPRRVVHIDWWGATLVAAAASVLLIWVTLAGSSYDWVSVPSALMVLGVIALGVGFVLVERRAAEPVLPLHMFRNRTVTLASLSACFIGLAMLGSTVFLSQYFQTSRGDTPTQAGISTLPLITGLFLSSLISGQVITRTGRWKVWLLVGCVFVTAGFGALGTLRMDTPYLLIALFMAIAGMGVGMTQQNLVLSVQNAVPMSELGVASSTVAFWRSLGGAVGVGILGAILAADVSSHIRAGLAGLGVPADAVAAGGLPDLTTLPAPVVAVIRESYGFAAGDLFLVAAPVTLVALVAVLFIPEIPLRRTNTGTSSDERETVAGPLPRTVLAAGK